MDTTNIPVSKISTEVDWDRIILFRRRFNILWVNFKDLNIGTLSGGFSKTDKGEYKGGFVLPNEYRLKGLYVDFRHFYLNAEQTNIYKFANYLSTLTDSDEFRTFIKNEKKKLKFLKPTHSLFKNPKSYLKFLNAMIIPTIGIYLYTNSIIIAGILIKSNAILTFFLRFFLGLICSINNSPNS